jgi:hypothetical protein
MTATLLKMPSLNIKYDIPVVTPEERVRWFKLTPTAKLVETFIKVEYNKRYLLATALTTKLQLEQYIYELNAAE